MKEYLGEARDEADVGARKTNAVEVLTRAGRWRVIAGMAGVCMVAACAVRALAAPAPPARPQDAVVRIELDPMGFQTLQSEYLSAGSSMLTVDFVDAEHLLVTFEVRRLMKREPDAPPTEQDRVVRGSVVEIASGKVLAQTEWRLHDRSQYLWNLGNGRFLLRIRNELSLLAPLQGRPENAFETKPFLGSERRIVDVRLSPERDLMTVISVNQPEAANGQDARLRPRPAAPAQYNFFRLKNDGGAHGDPQPVAAGAIRTSVPAALPVTTGGYLDVVQSSKNTWVFNFDEHTGKVDELPALDTSCFPRPVFVDRSQFVAFGCRGGEERRMLAAFNLRGEEMWQQGFYEPYVAPTFSFAPGAGRFALARIIVPMGIGETDRVSADLVRTQEVRVYQTHDGRQLFHVDCTPAERAGQNFALSPDGLHLAVVREVEVKHKSTKDSEAYVGKATGVEIYLLPELTAQDQSAVKAAEAMAPPDTGAAIDQSLARIAAGKTPEQQAGGRDRPDRTPPGVPGQTALAPAPPSASEPQTGNSGDAAGASPIPASDPARSDDGSAPRRPPTLYNPGEQPGAPPPNK